MRNALVTAAALFAAAVLLWQSQGDEQPDEVIAASGGMATETGRNFGPSLTGTGETEPPLAEPQWADHDIPVEAPDNAAPAPAMSDDRSSLDEVAGNPAAAEQSQPPSPEPEPEFPGDPIKGIIQTMIEDGAPEEIIASFERRLAFGAMTPEERREAAELEPQHEPPTPEQLEDVIWHAHFNGDIPDEIVEALVEEHWRRVEEKELRRLERDEGLSEDPQD